MKPQSVHRVRSFWKREGMAVDLGKLADWSVVVGGVLWPVSFNSQWSGSQIQHSLCPGVQLYGEGRPRSPYKENGDAKGTPGCLRGWLDSRVSSTKSCGVLSCAVALHWLMWSLGVGDGDQDEALSTWGTCSGRESFPVKKLSCCVCIYYEEVITLIAIKIQWNVPLDPVWQGCLLGVYTPSVVNLFPFSSSRNYLGGEF